MIQLLQQVVHEQSYDYSMIRNLGFLFCAQNRSIVSLFFVEASFKRLKALLFVMQAQHIYHEGIHRRCLRRVLS